MTALSEDELLVLAHISPRMFGTDEPIRSADVVQRLAKTLSIDHVDVILRYLHTAGLAEQVSVDNGCTYRATLAGNAAIVATSSVIAKLEADRLRKRNNVAQAIPEQMHAKSIDWTKWGTILAGVGIVVTIILWCFS